MQPEQPGIMGCVDMETMRLSTPVARPEMAPSTTSYCGPRNYPAIERWSKACEDDFERRCDMHEYMALSPVFVVNGCARVDDINIRRENQGFRGCIGCKRHDWAGQSSARICDREYRLRQGSSKDIVTFYR